MIDAFPTYVKDRKTYCQRCSGSLGITKGDVFIGAIIGSIFYFSGGFQWMQSALGQGTSSLLLGFVFPTILLIEIIHAIRKG